MVVVSDRYKKSCISVCLFVVVVVVLSNGVSTCNGKREWVMC